MACAAASAGASDAANEAAALPPAPAATGDVTSADMSCACAARSAARAAPACAASSPSTGGTSSDDGSSHSPPHSPPAARLTSHASSPPTSAQPTCSGFRGARFLGGLERFGGLGFVEVVAADGGVGQDGDHVGLDLEDAAGDEDEFFFAVIGTLDAHGARLDPGDQRCVLRQALLIICRLCG